MGRKMGRQKRDGVVRTDLARGSAAAGRTGAVKVGRGVGRQMAGAAVVARRRGAGVIHHLPIRIVRCSIRKKKKGTSGQSERSAGVLPAGRGPTPLIGRTVLVRNPKDNVGGGNQSICNK